ncbi:hypothetical protein TGAM01_v201240 [Trichoderma gamsii]|uniref:Hypervirulence associated protein TUDOR domain-containing protein n=1 Tax=Trichoderma gamsii TaxID=398673 RepID=A0A2P4ZZZ1_9HYPO|nr:hypothetical protein TGAM01_v201240 [Trichoderma gamsii]PON29874.1 hypothetical protein TGAM01_v201240 [Trichoderma gamsii]
MASKVQDKEGKPIEEGDDVWTPIRGGKREGEVEQVVTTEEEAKEANVKHPPKVVFTDQHGHGVAHNPEALKHKEE